MHTHHKLAAALALFAASVLPVQAQTITMSPSVSSVAVGSSFTVNVIISGVIDLYSWELDLGFGPISRVASTAQATGPFFGGGDLFTAGTLNAAAGTITNVSSTRFGPVGVDGTGSIATLTFNALSVGQATFGFSRVLLGDSNLNQIFISNANWTGGQVTIVPEPTTALLAALGLVLTVAAVRRTKA